MLGRGRAYVKSEGSDFGSNLRFLNIAARGLSNSIFLERELIRKLAFLGTQTEPISHLKHIVEWE